jgi:hypothetical protein
VGGCFILALDLKEKLVPVNRNHLICNNLDYGPWFGDNDMVYDQCDIFESSFAGLISSYNTEDRKYQNNWEAYKSISGATESYKFKVPEYEVFRVIR